MLHIAVRLFCGAMVALAALAGGIAGGIVLTARYEHDAPPTHQAAQTVPPAQSSTTRQVLVVMPKLSKCSAPDNGATLTASLAKLVQLVEPMMPPDQVVTLVNGALLRDAKEQVPNHDLTVVGVATTICVVRLVNDDNQVVWRVEFPGNKAAMTQQR